MKYYQNTDLSKNIGEKTGREFAVFFRGKRSYVKYLDDGSEKLVKEDAGIDQEVFEKGILTREIKCIYFS